MICCDGLLRSGSSSCQKSSCALRRGRLIRRSIALTIRNGPDRNLVSRRITGRGSFIFYPKGQKAAGSGTGNLGPVVGGHRASPLPAQEGILMICELLTRLRFLILRKKRGELDEEIR